MSSNITAWLVPVLLAVACVALVGNIFHAKKVNKSLVGDIEAAEAVLKVASNNGKECDTKLKAKIAEVAPKDEQVATLTEKKTKMQEQITKLTADLEQANATQTALKTEKDKLIADLKAEKETVPKV